MAISFFGRLEAIAWNVIFEKPQRSSLFRTKQCDRQSNVEQRLQRGKAIRPAIERLDSLLVRSDFPLYTALGGLSHYFPVCQ